MNLLESTKPGWLSGFQHKVNPTALRRSGVRSWQTPDNPGGIRPTCADPTAGQTGEQPFIIMKLEYHRQLATEPLSTKAATGGLPTTRVGLTLCWNPLSQPGLVDSNIMRRGWELLMASWHLRPLNFAASPLPELENRGEQYHISPMPV